MQQILTDEEIESLTYERLKRIDEKGYIEIFISERNMWTKEHRYFVERKIGRSLKSEESVHHINGDKQDNRLENLFPFHTQSEHKSFENRVKQFGITNPVRELIKHRFDNF